MLIPREYFTLNEVLEDWGISEPELGYVVEMGQLTLSVRIYGSFTVADRKDRPGRRNLILRAWWISSGATRCAFCASKHARSPPSP